MISNCFPSPERKVLSLIESSPVSIFSILFTCNLSLLHLDILRLPVLLHLRRWRCHHNSPKFLGTVWYNASHLNRIFTWTFCLPFCHLVIFWLSRLFTSPFSRLSCLRQYFVICPSLLHAKHTTFSLLTSWSSSFRFGAQGYFLWLLKCFFILKASALAFPSSDDVYI